MREGAHDASDSAPVRGQTKDASVSMGDGGETQNAGGDAAVAVRESDAAADPTGAVRHPLMGQRAYPAPAYPVENPDADDKALLGKILFWEEQLSGDDSVACGTCHRGSAGGSDPRAASDAARLPGADGRLDDAPSRTSDDIRGALGIVACDADGMRTGARVQVTQRKPPSAFDAMFSGELFWDGRATKDFRDPDTQAVLITGVLDTQSGRIVGGALESQAVGPPLSVVEMSCAQPNWPRLYEKLRRVTPLARATQVPAEMLDFIEAHYASYPEMFAAVFGSALKGAADPYEVISASRIAFAIATYERRLTSNQTPWDRWNAGEVDALTPEQIRGFELFMGKSNCQACHRPPLFMDLSFHYLGFHAIEQDRGRGGVEGAQSSTLGMMKTPSLRNVGLRGRGGLLHQGDGPGHDLQSVLALYNEGGRREEPAVAAQLDPLLVPLELSEEQQQALLAFLRLGLTDPRVQNETPPFDRPRLGSER
jgi:cytochrome c peroxidase